MVDAHVPGGTRRYGLDLGRHEVLLHHAVLPVQVVQHCQLHLLLGLLVIHGPRGDQDVHVLTLHDIWGLSLGLGLAPEVGQEIGDHEHGVVGLLTDGDVHGLTVGQHHRAVERQGYGGPLVLLDATVVVGLEHGQLGCPVLIKGLLLEVQAGCVDVGDDHQDAILHRSLAQYGHGHALATIDDVDLGAGLGGLDLGQVLEAAIRSGLDDELGDLTEPLALGEERLVSLAEGHHDLLVLLGKTVPDHLLLVEEPLLQFALAIIIVLLLLGALLRRHRTTPRGKA